MLQEDQTLKKFVEISVIDTGIGIEYEDQDKLFKLFGFVQDTQGLNTHGIGLGLVIAE
jgi:signal transduction histidine kinase